MGIKEEIKDRIQRTGHHPFLFVGAGISRRYLHTENWEDLLRHFCIEFSRNKFQYDLYASQVSEKEYYGKQPQIAMLLERDYSLKILSDPCFEEFREKNKEEIQKGTSPLKIAVAEYCQQKLKNIDYNDPELLLLKKAAKKSISGVITTNYDGFMEEICNGYTVFTGQRELIFSDIYEFDEIYKIHGSFDDPSGIVLTSEDYKNLEETQPYLIAKIMTIFMEYPIIFLGYSISDRDIFNILSEIGICLGQEQLDILKDRFIFVEFADGNKIETSSFSFENGRRIEMTRIKTREFSPIYEAMLEVEAKYTPRVMRQLRKDIYEMVKKNNGSSQRIVATGFEGIEQLREDDKIIIGVGTNNNAARVIKAEEIYEDVILDNKFFNPEIVIEEYLPELLKTNSGGLPMHKYLSFYDKPIFGRIKENMLRFTSMDKFLNGQLNDAKINYRKELSELNIKAVIQREGEENAYKKIYFLEEEEINVNELGDYLKNILKLKGKDYLKNNSELKRLIRIYDWLKYYRSVPQ